MFKNITKEEYESLTAEIDYSTLTDDDFLSLCETAQKLYPLNEMAMSRGQFRAFCEDHRLQILFNLVNIIILGSYEQFYEYVNHWKKELMSHINPLYDRNCEKSVKRDEIIYDNIIRVVVDPDTWQWDNDEIIKRALNDEIRKGLTNSKYIKEVRFIKQHILTNIDIEMELHANAFADIFKSLVKAFKEKDIDIFKKTLNKYTI